MRREGYKVWVVWLCSVLSGYLTKGLILYNSMKQWVWWRLCTWWCCCSCLSSSHWSWQSCLSLTADRRTLSGWRELWEPPSSLLPPPPQTTPAHDTTRIPTRAPSLTQRIHPGRKWGRSCCLLFVLFLIVERAGVWACQEWARSQYNDTGAPAVPGPGRLVWSCGGREGAQLW